MDTGAAAHAVTFLFTDIEGSTRLWEQGPDRMRPALARHDALARAAVGSCGGTLVKTTGDGVYAVFADATDAVGAALQLQLALADPAATGGVALRVRAGLHRGSVERRDNDYFGGAVNRAARIMDAAHGGQTLLSESVAGEVRDRLPAPASLIDLGTHRLRDLARPEHVFQLAHPRLPREFPALRTLDAMPHNLPAQATSFVGRDAELPAVLDVLSRHHLVTLTGPGGIGKTRLALQAGAQLLPRYPAGAWLVGVAPLTEPQLVAEAAAALFGLSPPSAGAAGAVATFLKDKRALLILDNCEHQVAACAELAGAVLAGCPGVALLATSREALAVPGEYLLRVAPLAVPEATQTPSAASALSSGAVRLFVDRAEAATGSFALTDANAAAVADICRRLDGVALAIELAAPRLRMLSPSQLLERLADRFALLTGGARTALPRQQTLRATIDWSFDLLSGDERALLRRLSVFAGGFTLDAAAAVVAGPPIAAAQVFDLLTSLADKSLVSVDMGSPVPRYALLGSTRDYALEKLALAGEDGFRRRHAEWVRDLFRRAEAEWQTTPSEVWLRACGPELDNLRAALEWSFGPGGDPILGATTFAFTGQYWIEVSLQGEFRRWLELALPHATDALPPGVAARLWYCHAQTGSPGSPAHVASATRAIEAARQAAEPELLGRALAHASYLLRNPDPPTADAHLAEAEAVLRPLGRTKSLAGLFNVVGGARFLAGDVEGSRAAYAEAIAVAEAVGHWLGTAAPAFNLVDNGFQQGNTEAAIADAGRLVDELRRRRRLGLLGLALFYYGDYLLAADRHAEARATGIEGIRLNRSLGRSAPVNACVETVALAIALQGDCERAARLAGRVAAFYASIASVRGATQQRTWDRLQALLAATLGPEALARLAAEGARWSEERAIDAATA